MRCAGGRRWGRPEGLDGCAGPICARIGRRPDATRRRPTPASRRAAAARASVEGVGTTATGLMLAVMGSMRAEPTPRAEVRGGAVVQLQAVQDLERRRDADGQAVEHATAHRHAPADGSQRIARVGAAVTPGLVEVEPEVHRQAQRQVRDLQLEGRIGDDAALQSERDGCGLRQRRDQGGHQRRSA